MLQSSNTHSPAAHVVAVETSPAAHESGLHNLTNLYLTLCKDANHLNKDADRERLKEVVSQARGERHRLAEVTVPDHARWYPIQLMADPHNVRIIRQCLVFGISAFMARQNESSGSPLRTETESAVSDMLDMLDTLESAVFPELNHHI